MLLKNSQPARRLPNPVVCASSTYTSQRGRAERGVRCAWRIPWALDQALARDCHIGFPNW